MIFCIGFLIFIGFYLICCDYFKIPLLSFSKTTRNIINKSKEKNSLIKTIKNDLSIFISKFIHLNEYKKLQLETDLKCAGINKSPEKHIADAIIRAFPVAILAIISLYILPLLTPILVLLSYFLYLQSSKKVQNLISKKREAIDFELPRFVDTIKNKLKHNRDVLEILNEYINVASPEFRDELSITVADMRTGNYETAITRLDSRVGSAMLSDVTRGLIGIIRGDNSVSYWDSLSIKFSDHQRQTLRLKAHKVPSKVNRLSMCLLVCFIFCYLVVLGIQIYSSLMGMFN